MKSLTSVSWCFILIGILTPNLFGQKRSITANQLLEISQEVYTKLHRPGTRQIVSFDSNGNITKQWAQSADRIYEGVLPFFESEQTLLELELTGQQQNRYRKVIAEWNKALKKQIQSIKDANTNKEGPEKYREIAKSMRSLSEEKQEEIVEVLTQRQRSRLGQLRFRFLIRTYGMSIVLRHEKIRQLLKATEQDMAALRSQWDRRKKEIVIKMATAQKQAVETAFAPLSDKQREALFDKWPFLKGEKKPQIDRLRIQLQFYDEYKSLKKIENPFCKVDRFPNYEVDFSGFMKPEELTFKIDPQDEGYISARIIFQMLENRELDALDLSDNQKMLLENQRKKYREATYLATQIAMKNKAKTEMERKITWLQSNSVRRSIGEQVMKGIDNILLPMQRKELESMPLKALATQYGPAYDLINGPLGESLELSPRQKNALKKSFIKARKQLDESAIEMEEFWIQDSFRMLGKAKNKVLRQIVGPKLLETPPILSNYILRNQLNLP